VELGKLADGHRAATGEFFEVVIRADHVSVLIVELRTTKLLKDIGGGPIAINDAPYSSIGKS